MRLGRCHRRKRGLPGQLLLTMGVRTSWKLDSLGRTLIHGEEIQRLVKKLMVDSD
jgi:hypothetical protein